MTSLLFYKLIFLAIVPAFVLGAGIYLKDRYMREPLRWVVLALVCGILAQMVAYIVESVFIDIELSYPAEEYAAGVLSDSLSKGDYLSRAFFGESIPCVVGQMLVLYLFLRYNPYFHDRHDATLYGAMLGVGFALAQNFVYMLSVLESEDGVVLYGHLLSSVPAEMLVGLLMGYFYSLSYYGGKNKTAPLLRVLIYPFLTQMLYCSTYYLVVRRLDSIWAIIVFAVLLYVLAIWAYLRLHHRMNMLVLDDKHSRRSVSYYYNTGSSK